MNCTSTFFGYLMDVKKTLLSNFCRDKYTEKNCKMIDGEKHRTMYTPHSTLIRCFRIVRPRFV